MPCGIFLYEIDKQFGPNVLAEYYLDKIEVSTDVLKKLNEKHIEKNLLDATTEDNDYRFYSSKIESESNKLKNLYLGFILRENEDLVSLKSLFDKAENNILEKFDPKNKQKAKKMLKETLNSIMSLMEKLKEPTIIQETINEKTKCLLDEGKLQEARELIDLGEKIPGELSELVKDAEEDFHQEDYKKSKKKFLKAAELAESIQEDEIVIFLENKAEKIGCFPDLINEREDIQEDIKDLYKEFDAEQLQIFKKMIDPIQRLIEISNNFEENEIYDFLTSLLKDIKEASRLSSQLSDLDKILNDKIKKL